MHTLTAHRVTPAVTRTRERSALQPLIYLAWIVALTATLGSLYFSEIRGFIPCTLCWWQRILMYPMSITLGVATFRGDARGWAYAQPLSLTGLAVSTHHYLIQKIPGYGPAAACNSGVPCHAEYIEWAGFITIPFLAGTAFLLISVLLLTHATRTAKRA